MKKYIAYFLNLSTPFSCPEEWDEEGVINAGCHAVASFAIHNYHIMRVLFNMIDHKAYNYDEFVNQSKMHQKEDLGELLYEDGSIVTVEEDN